MKGKLGLGNTRGLATPLLVCLLLIAGVLAATGAALARARMNSTHILEAKLEEARIAKGTARFRAINYVRLNSGSTPTSSPQMGTIPTIANSVTAVSVTSAFPLSPLTTPRETPYQSNGLWGPPGGIPSAVEYAEPLRELGLIQIERPSNILGASVQSEIQYQSCVWRIPAGAVQFLASSRVDPLSTFSVDVDGIAVIQQDTLPQNVRATKAYIGNKDCYFTTGYDCADAIEAIYKNTLQIAHTSIKAGTNPPIAPLEEGTDGANVYSVLDLAQYNGPQLIHISGGAVVIIGSPISGSPLTIVCDDNYPVFLAGSNYRHTTIVSRNATWTILSTASFDPSTNTWDLPRSSAVASDTTWIGHWFMAGSNTTVTTAETWKNRQYTINGSLHLKGGLMQAHGSLSTLKISKYDFSTGNPFTLNNRHESMLVLPIQ